MIDSFHRPIDYLRLSVTDRCNLRCVYCMPRSSPRFTASEDVLTDDEIVELVSCLAELGISKIRITGGEPLVRPGLPDLVARIARVPGIVDLSLSTNGVLLSDHAQNLKNAGLKRVNISLDSLLSDRFQEIARFGSLADVMKGIDSALETGLEPVKLNVVVARGMNDDEIARFAHLTVDRPLHVRFIELMPMGDTGFFSPERRVPLNDMLAAAAPLEPLPQQRWPVGHGPARYYRRPGALGTLGFISALSCGFCSACNRVRLSADGTLIPCLDAVSGTDLRAPLRAGKGREHLKALAGDAILHKPESHDMNARLAASNTNPRFMCQIGG
ncbi:MAG: GTP 3',8-cyclase MoaA [Elusimicrobiota bacterium]